jgi:hypothetical protein
VIANLAFNEQTAGPQPSSGSQASFTNDPFLFTGTASFSYQGNTIFSSLALIGSGLVGGFAFQDNPASGFFDNGGNITYTFQGVSSPEPSSMAFAATGILGLLIGIERRHRSLKAR